MSSSVDTANRLGVIYEPIEPPQIADIDHALFLQVVVHNTGTDIWPSTGPHPINLSFHWRDAYGEIVDFDGVRTMLSHPLPPGTSVELELVVEPPHRPGDYLLELDMVEENRGWFSYQGIQSYTLPIRIIDNPADAPRVCIINHNCSVNDAVGNHIVHQINYFLDQGYEVLALLESVDLRRPAHIRQYMITTSQDALASAETNSSQRARRFFEKADLYIFHYPIFYPLFETISWVERGMVIMDYHGVTPPQFWEGPGVEGLIEGQRRLALARYADYAIAHSNYARDELLVSRAITPERVFVMPYVVPLQGFQPGPRDAEYVERYGLHDRPVLLYVGRMAGNKRVIDLVRALPLIQRQHPGTVLLLAGDKTTPPYGIVVAAALAEARQVGCADDVVFTGPVDHSQLHRLYNTCDVYVTSSLHEGFCIPVIEAMACGVPAVGTHITALPETIGDSGLTFQPEDPADLARKVIALLDNRRVAR
jgi:glycosyltransferase involved in cell wall biosynthesis